MADHAWTHENLDAYLADGLTLTERQDVEAHINACAECTQAVAESRKLEQTMADLFAKDRPDADLEERAIARLRKSRITRATALRFVGAAAAVLVLGLLGAAMQAIAFSEGGFYAGRPMAKNQLRAAVMVDDARSMGEAEPFTIVDDPIARVGEIIIGWKAVEEKNIGEGKDGKRKELAANIEGKKDNSGEAPDAEQGKSGGGSGRVQFAPVFVSPTTDWAVPRIMERFEGRPEDKAQKGIIENLDKSLSKQKINEAITERDPIMFPNLATWKATIAPRKDYYQPAEIALADSPRKPRVVEAKPAQKKPADGPSEDGEKKDKGKADPKKEPPPLAPEPAPRKIIRTGDMEFEIDSFDKAAKSVKQLIETVKGGFIATANSNQLPNGKMRGSIVVRMPPEHLDKFTDDLRRELIKVGELRSERIGSQDVSKQYTDTAGELRAARVVETRLLEIIKTGKGEVKDLIAAENQLGIWRTKIEKMEGEIRFYDNQVGLSTLTIALIEKEIQAPSALVVTDHVTMRIEVEQVIEAHKAALEAVKEAKGRVTKSELKLHKAGQLEAILHAEIPPAQKKAFRDKLKKLGIVTIHEETQRQEAEGGTGRADQIKQRVKDVEFEIALNNIVNIPPRHSVALVVATTDVLASFAKLQAKILGIANGQVRDAKLNEKDKQNVSADIEFNVPVEQKAAIDKLIGDLGPVLTRSTSQVAVTEFATDRKFGYKLTLTSVANVPPREVIGLKIEVKDVDKNVAQMKEMVGADKGRVVDASVARQENGQVTAVLVFDVPLLPRLDSDLLVKRIKEAGNLLSQKTERDPAVPENKLATARIVVMLQGVFAGKEPREKIDLRIEVEDVEKKMAEMKDKVRASNGRVLDEKSGRQANGQAGARLVFEVPLAKVDGLVQQFKESGNLVSYATQRNLQVPENDLASAQIVVVLGGVNPIMPSDDSYFRQSLSLSYKVFAWCMLAILVGLSAVVPVGAVVFIVYWMIRKAWPTNGSATP